jgi:hypothetical protein
MAHHIASLMQAAEAADADERAAAAQSCFDAILRLWEHRYELPDGKRPFGDLEPVMRAVASLDPDDRTPRYFRAPQQAARDDEPGSKSQEWLTTAAGLDYSAKLLIGQCLMEAAREAVDKSKPWIALAETAGVGDGLPEIIIRYVSAEDSLGKDVDLHEKARTELKDRIHRLEAFMLMAGGVVADYKERLAALPEAPEGSSSDPAPSRRRRRPRDPG